MNHVPIAFAFDNNLVHPACVCISSLLMNANEDTFYDIYIIHAENVELNKDGLDKLPLTFHNCKIQYRTVGNVFKSAFEIRGITQATYYRLLIPVLIPEYDKIIYSDVDIIFRLDLTEIYNEPLKNNYIAATLDVGMNYSNDGINYIHSMKELQTGKYIQAGFCILNNKVLRENCIVDVFIEYAAKKLKFQDQDILNIVCRNRIKYIPIKYNVTTYANQYIVEHPNILVEQFSKDEMHEALYSGNIHYNGNKPWVKYCLSFDIWWEYYRKSPFFDEKLYYVFFNEKLDEYDRLSLLKRIKILARYFIFGRKR